MQTTYITGHDRTGQARTGQSRACRDTTGHHATGQDTERAEHISQERARSWLSCIGKGKDISCGKEMSSTILGSVRAPEPRTVERELVTLRHRELLNPESYRTLRAVEPVFALAQDLPSLALNHG